MTTPSIEPWEPMNSRNFRSAVASLVQVPVTASPSSANRTVT
ncbi:hypothetical protein [Streptomyces sp. NPDC060243]